MRLRNKKTGEVGILIVDGAYNFVTNLAVENDERDRLGEYDSLAELNAEWEDAPEEPKECWYIDCYGTVIRSLVNDNEWGERKKEIGNYFETKEEAEKAVEKLKAWKRLKDKGFKITMRGCKGNAWLGANWGNLQGDYSDVLSLFGGEE